MEILQKLPNYSVHRKPAELNKLKTPKKFPKRRNLIVFFSKVEPRFYLIKFQLTTLYFRKHIQLQDCGLLSMQRWIDGRHCSKFFKFFSVCSNLSPSRKYPLNLVYQISLKFFQPIETNYKNYLKVAFYTGKRKRSCQIRMKTVIFLRFPN